MEEIEVEAIDDDAEDVLEEVGDEDLFFHFFDGEVV